MALIISIPQYVQATGTYYSYGDHEITYNNYLYGFYITSDSTSGLPNDYKISYEVFEDIIKSDAKGFQLDLANRIDTFGIKIAEWSLNGLENYCNFVYGLFTNAYQALNSFSHDFIWSGTTTYSWNYHFTGADANYPGFGDYGTAYGFRFIGACGEIIDVVLDSNGDYYGHSPIGNWTPSEDPAPTNWILINQGLDNFYVPSANLGNFNDLKQPYIEGKTLHFFIYFGSTEHEVVISDFTETCIEFNNKYTTVSPFLVFGKRSGSVPDIYLDGNLSNNLRNTENVFVNNNHFSSGATGYQFLIYSVSGYSGSRDLSFNLPCFQTQQISNSTYPYTIYTNNILGLFHNNLVSGSGDIYLKGFSYEPQTTPQPFPENPIPITSIPEDPDDPIPDSNPDPVPGIEYPVNPTPPPLRPVPSIVSGNDDLWPSVVQLQDIEFDLSSYISGLSDYDFPDLSSITSSFSGAIVWVSTIMSTLFNGSDFSILFAVLSSFFIVAALLGLYKWWNHK